MGETERRCVVISASPENDPDLIRKSVRETDYIICADGGIDAAAKAGVMPDLIVGDLDSAENTDSFPNVETIVLETTKDDTDTMHCAEIAVEKGFKHFLFLGCTGGRTDHALANLSVLVYLAENDADGIISDNYNDICLLKNGVNVVNTSPGTTVSVMPFGCECAVLSYKGLVYPLDHGMVKLSYPYTISNVTADSHAIIELHSGIALLFYIKK